MSDSSTTEEPAPAPSWQGLPENLSRLRQKLYQKAKREPKFRFYSLYGLVLRQDVMMAAWEQVRRNKGAAGVDGVTIQQIVGSEEGPVRFVDQIREELRTHTSAEPAPLPTSAWGEPVSALSDLGFGGAVKAAGFLVYAYGEALGSAGCGKSARPVG